MLRSKSGLSLNLYYSEFLSNKLSFNLNLMNKINNNLYNDETKIINAIQTTQTL